MKFEQLIEEMEKSSGLSSYYFEMLKSIGDVWEEFIEDWSGYTRIPAKNKEIMVRSSCDMIGKAREFGERLSYIFRCIRKDSEKEYQT